MRESDPARERSEPERPTPSLPTRSESDLTPETGVGVLARLVIGLISLYQATAVLRQARCRFRPSCSSYASDSVKVHGLLRGGAYAVRRIGRCHPFNPGGIDPVPRK